MLFFDDFLNFADDNGNGVAYPNKIKGTGEIERFTVKGDKKGSLNGWLIWRDELKPSCTFGSWKTGQHMTWFAESEENISDKEKKERKRQIAESRAKAKRQHREEQEKARIAAAQTAMDKWNAASESDTSDHQYVKAKCITPYFSRVEQETGALIVPMMNHEGLLANAQRIYPSGKKMFLPGGQVSGTLLTLEPESADCDKVFIVEGYSTGCTIRDISNCATIICWNAGNLKFAAQYASVKYPDCSVFMCADNDHQTYINGVKTNVGEEKAIEAMNSANTHNNIRVLFYGTEQYGTDWNDYYCMRGYDETCAWFDFRLSASINGEPEYV